MFRLFVAIVLTVVAVVFTMANTHQVELSFIVGSPAKVRLIFLMLVSFIFGVIVSAFAAMISRIRLTTRLRQELEIRNDHAGD